MTHEKNISTAADLTQCGGCGDGAADLRTEIPKSVGFTWLFMLCVTITNDKLTDCLFGVGVLFKYGEADVWEYNYAISSINEIHYDGIREFYVFFFHISFSLMVEYTLWWTCDYDQVICLDAIFLVGMLRRFLDVLW